MSILLNFNVGFSYTLLPRIDHSIHFRANSLGSVVNFIVPLSPTLFSLQTLPCFVPLAHHHKHVWDTFEFVVANLTTNFLIAIIY